MLKLGDTLEAVGLSGSFAEGTRIRVRDTKELVKVDKTATVNTATVNPGTPNGDNGWYTTDVTVTMTSVDEESGVNSPEYRINGGEWAAYSDALQLTTDGIYKIEYRSVDGAGNVEETKMKEIKIDQTVPELSFSVDKPTLLVPNHKLVDIKALLDYSDATSGISSVVLESITINEANSDSSDISGALYKTLDTDFALRSERNGKGNGRIYTITYHAADQAGNTTEAQATVTVLKGR